MSSAFPPQPGSPYGSYRPPAPPAGKAVVIAPAIALLIVGILGFSAAVVNTAVVLWGAPQRVPEDAPEWVRRFQEGSRGPIAAVVQSLFVVLNLVIIIGAIQMMRIRSWGLALAASILAMIDLTGCCCLMGFPVGIWSVIVLSLENVRRLFTYQQQAATVSPYAVSGGSPAGYSPFAQPGTYYEPDWRPDATPESRPDDDGLPG